MSITYKSYTLSYAYQIVAYNLKNNIETSHVHTHVMSSGYGYKDKMGKSTEEFFFFFLLISSVVMNFCMLFIHCSTIFCFMGKRKEKREGVDYS